MAGLVLALLGTLLLLPSSPLQRFDGLPLGSVPEFTALALLLPLLASRVVRRVHRRAFGRGGPRLRRALLGAGLLALGLKLVLLGTGVHESFLACYRTPLGPPPAGACERSWENPFFRFAATRLDRAVDFAPGRWNLSFVNSLRFNFYAEVPGKVRRDRLPIEATWRGDVERSEPWVARVTYVGRATVSIGPATRELPPLRRPGDGPARGARGPLPAGSALRVRRRLPDPGSAAVRSLRDLRIARERPAGGEARLRAARAAWGWRAAAWVADGLLGAWWGGCWWCWLRWFAGRGRPGRGRGGRHLRGTGSGVAAPRRPARRAGRAGAPLDRPPRVEPLTDPPRPVLRRARPRGGHGGAPRGRSPRGARSIRGRRLAHLRVLRADHPGERIVAGRRERLPQPAAVPLRAVRRPAPARRRRASVSRLGPHRPGVRGPMGRGPVRRSPASARADRGVPRRRPAPAGRGQLGAGRLASARPLSEPATWIALVFAFPLLLASDSARAWGVGAALAGLSIATRPNQAPGTILLLGAFLATALPLRPRAALVAAGLSLAAALLPLAHNLYYGGRWVLFTTTAAVPATLALPPARWPASSTTRGRALAWTRCSTCLLAAQQDQTSIWPSRPPGRLAAGDRDGGATPRRASAPTWRSSRSRRLPGRPLRLRRHQLFPPPRDRRLPRDGAGGPVRRRPPGETPPGAESAASKGPLYDVKK